MICRNVWELGNFQLLPTDDFILKVIATKVTENVDRVTEKLIEKASANGEKLTENKIYILNMNQLERIQQMEQLLDFVIEARKEQNINQEKSARIQEVIRILAKYYASDEWKQDFADDEAGLLPKDLKRGVLSEDGIWNVLDAQ